MGRSQLEMATLYIALDALPGSVARGDVVDVIVKKRWNLDETMTESLRTFRRRLPCRVGSALRQLQRDGLVRATGRRWVAIEPREVRMAELRREIARLQRELADLERAP